MDNGFNYYRIKTEWVSEKSDGGLEKTRTEELALVSSYTEAESVAHELVNSFGRAEFNSHVNIEIVKTKIDEILFNDVLCTEVDLIAGLINNYFKESDNTGVGLYAVKVMYIEIDGSTGKEKRSNETIYVPAESNTGAAKNVSDFLKKYETRNFVIRDTKFDKAESILWSPAIHKDKIRTFENR